MGLATFFWPAAGRSWATSHPRTTASNAAATNKLFVRFISASPISRNWSAEDARAAWKCKKNRNHTPTNDWERSSNGAAAAANRPERLPLLLVRIRAYQSAYACAPGSEQAWGAPPEPAHYRSTDCCVHQEQPILQFSMLVKGRRTLNGRANPIPHF